MSKNLLFIISCISFLIWSGVRIYKSEVTFYKHCDAYLKTAADANTIELAKKQLSKAVEYCETNRLTSGYTSIFFDTPDEDIEFWYSNLKASLNELNSVPENATQLEKSNVLMKLRETLLDTTSDGTEVTCPDGISIYPNNTAYMIWCLLSLTIAVVSGIAWLRENFY